MHRVCVSMDMIQMSFFIFFFVTLANAQVEDQEYQTVIDGQVVTVWIHNGDTTIIAELEKAVVMPLHSFPDGKEQERYIRYRRYANVVYPYAVHAVRLYNQLQKETEGKTDREKRKLVKKISKSLEDEFEKPLRNLTRTQGLILTKMIERELDRPFYDIVKELKGGFSAFYYNQIGKMNGYKIKDQYQQGEDEIMDMVLDEYDLKKDLQ